MSILVVGGGKMGLSHLAMLNRLAGEVDVALCDSSRLTRHVFGALGFKTHGSLAAAFQGPKKWQAAVVATPTSSHYAVAKALLEQAVPCFIEKPLTLNPQRSQELVALQAASGVAVQMGLVLRFVRPFVKLRSVIREQTLGRPLRYQAAMRGNVVTRPEPQGWRTDFSRGGGCLNEYGPHLLDLCRCLFGDVTALRSATFGRVHSVRADDSANIEWNHESGLSGTLLLDWCDTSQRKSGIEFQVEFEQGNVFANNAEFKPSLKPGLALAAGAQALLFEPLTPYPVNYYLRGEEYTLQLELFLERVLGRKLLRAELPADLAATLQDGLEVDKLICAIASKGGMA